MVFHGIAPEYVCKILYGSLAGCVEMVNSRGIYLSLCGRKILLCSHKYGVVPNGAALENWQELPPLLEVGQPIRAEGGFLQFLQAELNLQLDAVPSDTAVLQPSMPHAVRLLQACGKETGLSPLAGVFFGSGTAPTPLCRGAQEQLEKLLAALQEEAAAGVFSSVGSLLGLGTGLTPSGDDVLAGLLYGLRHSPLRGHSVAELLTDAIVTQAEEKTTAVSADVLLALAQDAPFERLKNAWCREDGAEALLEIGSNSGSEMLLGLLLANKLLEKKG